MKSILIGLLLFALHHTAQALEAVPGVDLSRYLGTWYEIAKYPNYFQEGCVASKTDYALWEAGVLEVNHRCLESDGKVSQRVGRADVTDARLKMQFYLKFIYLPFLQREYWIIKLDENYQYAVISEPSQQYLWILSRAKTMEDAIYQDLLTWLELQGFDLQRITKNDLSTMPENW
jgi:apolipoprotein D and lipocalin family protein